MMPDLTCLSRSLSFHLNHDIFHFRHIFRIEVKWLELAPFFSLKIFSCWTQFRALVVYGVGNIGKFSFYEIKKNYWRQLDWKMRGVAATNHQMCNTFEGLRKKCLF